MKKLVRCVFIAVVVTTDLLFSADLYAQAPTMPDSAEVENVPLHRRDRVKVELDDEDAEHCDVRHVTVVDLSGDTVHIAAADSITNIAGTELIATTEAARRDSLAKDSAFRATYGEVRVFTPNPTRAVWLSALFPGLGQIYNRRYWKLPIIVGGYVGLAYATSWNNGMLKDYTKAYSDAMDNDPNTKSYMDFFPSTTKEEDIDTTWLQSILKSRKDFYRRNRDLCIISMVALYLVCMIDAYVDASLAQFDITPELSMQVKPAVIEPQLGKLPAMGLQCAVKF